MHSKGNNYMSLTYLAVVVSQSEMLFLDYSINK